jgi:hypothetical protein
MNVKQFISRCGAPLLLRCSSFIKCDDRRRSFASGQAQPTRPQPCIRWIQGIPTMMQPCASGGESSGAVGPFYRAASRAKGQVGTPPPRTVIGGSSREADGHRNCLRLLLLISSRHDARAQDDTLWYIARGDEPPQRDEQLAGECYDHGLALLAGGDARLIPPCQGTVLLVD